MQRLSYTTETVLSNMVARKRIVLSFKDSPRKPLRRRRKVSYHIHRNKNAIKVYFANIREYLMTAASHRRGIPRTMTTRFISFT